MDLHPQFDDVLDNENVDTIILTLPVHDLRSPTANVVDTNENPPSTVVLTNGNSIASEDDMAISSTSLVRSDCGQLFLVTYDDSNRNASPKHCFNLQIDADQLLELKYPIDDFYKPSDEPIDTSELPDVPDVVQSGDTLQLAMQELEAESEALEPVPYEVKLAALEAMMLPDGETSEGGNRLFSCGVCFKSFTRRYELKSHLSRHFGMNVSLCPFCGKQFSHPSNLVRHVRIHTGSKPYKCKDCGKRFNQANSLHTHRASLHGSGNRKFACPLCGRSYKTNQLLKRHCRIVHRDENIRLDLSGLQSPGTLSRRQFYCPECGESFTEKKLLKEHREGHVQLDETAENEEDIQPELQLNLEAIDSMLREIQNGDNGDSVEELVEAIAIPEESKYAETVDEVVRKVRDLICFECGKQFHRYISYKQHWGVHESSMRSYECGECGLSFAWKSTFTKHVAQHSMPANAEPTNLIECFHSGCDKRYKTVGQMQEHVKRDHLMIRRFHCGDCDKQFYKAHDLLVHKRTHSKEKPYLCGTCGKSFSHVSHLIRHEKSHQNIRPYTCPICKKSFTQSTVLKAHRKKKCPDPITVAGSCNPSSDLITTV